MLPTWPFISVFQGVRGDGFMACQVCVTAGIRPLRIGSMGLMFRFSNGFPRSATSRCCHFVLPVGAHNSLEAVQLNSVLRVVRARGRTVHLPARW
ncbi:hypothetical protein C2E23DRAFT_829501 [Lenzites betulinus]|nr:hypothetical protein C2E23DRAFT_829501 [Lenzites betulinus]